MINREEGNSIIKIDFSIAELRRAMRKVKMSTPGSDQIWYIMINKLSEYSKLILLDIYNRKWEMT
jgi:hypothetical protein